MTPKKPIPTPGWVDRPHVACSQIFHQEILTPRNWSILLHQTVVCGLCPTNLCITIVCISTWHCWAPRVPVRGQDTLLCSLISSRSTHVWYSSDVWGPVHLKGPHSHEMHLSQWTELSPRHWEHFDSENDANIESESRFVLRTLRPWITSNDFLINFERDLIGCCDQSKSTLDFDLNNNFKLLIVSLFADQICDCRPRNFEIVTYKNDKTENDTKQENHSEWWTKRSADRHTAKGDVFDDEDSVLCPFETQLRRCDCYSHWSQNETVNICKERFWRGLRVCELEDVLRQTTSTGLQMTVTLTSI